MRLYFTKRMSFTLRLLPGLAAVLYWPAAYGQSGPSGGTGTAGSLAATATRVETEVVVLSNSAAVPNQIKRKPGKFFLVLKSRTSSALPTLVFDSPTLAAAQVSSLTQGFNAALFQRLNHGAVLFDLPTGELDLKSQATGKVFLKIIIQ